MAVLELKLPQVIEDQLQFARRTESINTLDSLISFTKSLAKTYIRNKNSLKETPKNNSVVCNYCKHRGHKEFQCRGKQLDTASGKPNHKDKALHVNLQLMFPLTIIHVENATLRVFFFKMSSVYQGKQLHSRAANGCYNFY